MAGDEFVAELAHRAGGDAPAAIHQTEAACHPTRERELLLDEPVAGMTDEETERTAELFLSLAGSHSLVVVEHDMAFIEKIARKITVLHEGSVLAEGTLDEVQADQKVVEVYLGAPHADG